MPLVNLRLPTRRAGRPRAVVRFLREAERRIERFIAHGRPGGFVPSDFEGAYHILRVLSATTLARGSSFCEWGSGFGVVAGLAALLDFEVCGIEANGELVEEARRLADDFELPVEFAHGSFVPRAAEDAVCSAGSYSWLTTDGDEAYEELGLGPEDFDIVFAYPWPDEEEVVASLFERYAGEGALLLTYHGGDGFRLRRKTERRSARAERE